MIKNKQTLKKQGELAAPIKIYTMKNTRNYSKSSIGSNTKSISVKPPRLSKIDRSNVTIPEEAKETLGGGVAIGRCAYTEKIFD